MASQFLTVTDLGDPGPWLLIALSDKGQPMAYIPGTGSWWCRPSMVAPYLFGGEIGAKSVTADEAAALVNAGLGPDRGAEIMATLGASILPKEWQSSDLPLPG